jgi:hypothetical protein
MLLHKKLTIKVGDFLSLFFKTAEVAKSENKLFFVNFYYTIKASRPIHNGLAWIFIS